MSPFRLDETRAKIQFTTAASMPYLVYQACVATGTCSNTRYIQVAVCEALARDLDLDLADLLADLPTPRTNAKTLHPHVRLMVGPANTVEEVR